MIRVNVRYGDKRIMWLEDLIEQVERQGSAPIYALLKRADEKFVTEQAYENPKFVEDMLRDVVAVLHTDPRITWYQVECESIESIHNHSVYAYQQERRANGEWQPTSEVEPC
jgi:GTP cyclohydrolase I